MVRDRNLHHGIAAEERETYADEYGQAQRRAFLDGFERAMSEDESMQELREWLEEKRDEAKRHHEQTGDAGDLARHLAYSNVLVRLSEMGCEPEQDGGDSDAE